MHRVHHFRTSQLAFNACFDDPHVREGDILVIATERVVGIASADPIAITIAHGDLKTFLRMTREELLAELAHDAAQISHAAADRTSRLANIPIFARSPVKRTSG